jgi:hypothetical protein
MTRTLLYVTIFLSAALLFLIQPLFAKLLLPFYGGATAVWIISIFFYSATLLAGYIYASLVTKWPLYQGRIIHGCLLVVTGALMLSRWFIEGAPVVVLESYGLSAEFSTLITLFYGVGLPVLLLASTSVIVQHLFALHTREDPYWLYTLSNAGSLIGLAIFPFILEPLVSLSFQADAWTIGFVAFTVLLLAAWRQVERDEQVSVRPIEAFRSMPNPLWIISIAAIPTFLLASLTDLYSRGIASFPLLWVIPLMLYLLSFVAAFRDKLPWSFPPLGLATVVSTVVAFCSLVFMNNSLILFGIAFAVGMLAFFLLATYLHRTLYLRRPDASQLGNFYIWLTLGGALGSGLVGLVLPFVLNTYVEVYLGLLAIAIYFVLTELDTLQKYVSTWAIRCIQVPLITALLLLGSQLIFDDRQIDTDRNFYGVISIKEFSSNLFGEPVDANIMVHGNTVHGLEAVDPANEPYAVSYYGPGSGIELSLRSFLERDIQPRVNVVGLGAGMMNTYCEDVAQLDYIEINQLVLDLAREHFTYLSRCPDTHRVLIGDGRLVLTDLPRQNYDIIMIDAFSDDAIPVHLLTQEAFVNAYLPQLSAEGVVAIHISNKYLNLFSAVAGMVVGTEYAAIAVQNPADENNGLSMPTAWVILAKDEQLKRILGYENTSLYTGRVTEWTDTKSSILSVLSMSGSRID